DDIWCSAFIFGNHFCRSRRWHLAFGKQASSFPYKILSCGSSIGDWQSTILRDILTPNLVRWLSGRKQRFAKAPYPKRLPRVRLPPSPLLAYATTTDGADSIWRNVALIQEHNPLLSNAIIRGTDVSV